MNLSNLPKIATTIALIVIALMSCAPISGSKTFGQSASVSDRLFQDLVREKMPGYQLTAGIIGRPVVASNAYSISVTDGDVVGEDRDTVITNFIGRFEAGGSGAFRLYFRSGLPTLTSRKFWRLDFVGCEPGNCVSNLKESSFQRVTRDEHGKHFILGPASESRDFELLREPIDGVGYRATVRVYFDSLGHVLKYYVSSYREPTTNDAAFREGRASSGVRSSKPTFRYARNVVLMNQAKTWRPRPLESDGVDRLFGL